MTSVIFHLAIPINNIETARDFYVDGLGCEVGRESRHAMILNLYGHQLVAHMTSDPLVPQKGIYPRHFGLIFPRESEWEQMLHRAIDNQLMFYEQPKHRFPGQLTEHRTFFLQDPFYNLMEMKFYRHADAIFGGRELAEVGDR
ncbi:VOC family protein [Desertifilum sp. FACHB-1129]|uniref:Glyoxalase n=2 Tax=Desertifilum tharense IPPAS B-1220 TaxID=1781255 RepID=A0A1E5QNS5_9CYAN|nr:MULTISPECIES: VOC family protein [Desertifilum]MDA0212225.1 VOC family protein [Cyanobacteria bacterium FC1]MBD2312804.1 VOC family protein [Desertifilum sp. FACHB-1129]MBD2324168.1 VOC family protein [Desertifilum sp. FACHB-866]MBD2334182.1 VOC family protein [Desertifilum sp. FACHB-868]OEJ76247.1 glyoxalase [Desertifilum tharense IPPAS B-1220]